MWPLTVLDESARVARTAAHDVELRSVFEALITVDAFSVALLNRRNPAPGSASVVVVEKV
jgi:hypothetical protein